MTCLFGGVWRSVEVEKFPASLLLLSGEEGALFPLTCLFGCVCRTVSLFAGAGPTPAGLLMTWHAVALWKCPYLVLLSGGHCWLEEGEEEEGSDRCKGGITS